MRVTITDIAQRAGVSKTTVSFAFNDPSKISKATHDRIMKIAAEYGYIPDPVARTLTKKRIGALGILLPQSITESFKNPYLIEMIRGMGDACEEGDFFLTVLPPVKGRIVDAARKAAVDGLLTIGVGPDTQIVELVRNRHIPFVTIDGSASTGIVNVGIDDEKAAYDLMRHVISLGHRSITVVELKSATFNLPEERFSYVRDRRMAGFDRAFREVGLSFADPRITVCATECTIEGGELAAEALMASRPGSPTAVVAMSDIVAIGICVAFRQHGMRVPEEVSVVGFDDIPFARFNIPPLTTIRQPGYEKGYESARLVRSVLEGGTATDLAFEATLVIRESSSGPRGKPGA
ncbi:MAG: LacI family DNA-binding transcriptional regulator [Spirochaetes bacterium]|nr:LacI family DNA-binding transcriptional regulator [Spirochaetota bacterium]